MIALTDWTPHCFYFEHDTFHVIIQLHRLRSVHIINVGSVAFADSTTPTGNLFAM